LVRRVDGLKFQITEFCWRQTSKNFTYRIFSSRKYKLHQFYRFNISWRKQECPWFDSVKPRRKSKQL